MAKEAKRIVIVQDRPTQFDVPFYRFILDKGEVDLCVYYTLASAGTGQQIDPEIGRAPEWDHLETGPESIDWIHYVVGLRVVPLADEIAAFGPDLVIICGYYPRLHAELAVLLKLRHISIGLRSDNTRRHSSFYGLKGVVKKTVLPLWLRLYDSWHPVGTLARCYLEWLSRTRRETYLFPYNVDNAWFARESERHRARRDELRQQMGLEPQDFAILGVMKWHPREDPLTLVDAVLDLRKDNATAKLILVGDGPLRNDVRKRLVSSQGNAYLPGYVPYSTLPKYYAVSDVFVHPAPDEPWGVSVNEAMACGIPVVAAEGVGAGKDLIIEGETGHIFPNYDKVTLCKILEQLVADPTTTAQIGHCAREKISEWGYEQSYREIVRAVSLAQAQVEHTASIE